MEPGARMPEDIFRPTVAPFDLPARPLAKIRMPRGRYLRWLERPAHNRLVEGSSPSRPNSPRTSRQSIFCMQTLVGDVAYSPQQSICVKPPRLYKASASGD